MVKSDDFILPLLHKEFSSATRDWTDAEVGAYTRLLIVQWDQGSIPEDISRIRKIADSIDSSKEVVLAKFKQCDQPGRLQNTKMELIREERKIFREKKSESGKEGAFKRWQKNSKDHSKDHSKTMPFSNEVEVEVEVDIEKKEVVTTTRKNFPPESQEVLQQFAINKPQHWSSEHMESEAVAWFDHYSANGWKVGKNKMKDWKATVRNWIRNDFNYAKKNNGTGNYKDKQAGVSQANAEKLQRIMDGNL